MEDREDGGDEEGREDGKMKDFLYYVVDEKMIVRLCD